jgi:hypothetical protein
MLMGHHQPAQPQQLVMAGSQLIAAVSTAAAGQQQQLSSAGSQLIAAVSTAAAAGQQQQQLSLAGSQLIAAVSTAAAGQQQQQQLVMAGNQLIAAVSTASVAGQQQQLSLGKAPQLKQLLVPPTAAVYSTTGTLSSGSSIGAKTADHTAGGTIRIDRDNEGENK